MKKIAYIEKKYKVQSTKYKAGRRLPGLRKQTGKIPAWYAQSDGVSGYVSGGVEEQLPWYEGLLRRYEGSLPKYEGLVPRYEILVPWYEGLVPRYEEQLPWYKELLPWFECLLHRYEERLPRYGERLPWYEEQLPKSEESRSDQSQCAEIALKGQNISARGNALGLNVPTNLLAPRSEVIQGDEFAWGKTNNMRMANNKRTNEIKTKENIQYSIFNIQCRNWEREESRSEQSQLAALKGRKITAQGNALCDDATTNFFAPRLNIIQGDKFAWGKNKTLLANQNRLAHLKKTEETCSLNNLTVSQFNSLSTIKYDNSILQRTDTEFSIVNLKYNKTTIMEFFSFSPPWEGLGEASYNIYLN